MDNEEVTVESLTYEQFLQEMSHPGSVQGTPAGTAFVIKKREPIPGTELLKKRVRVSFDFDVIVNDGPIINSGNDEDIKTHDLALLQQFLVADKDKLLEMLAYEAGLELGLNSCETFVETFLPQIEYSNDGMDQYIFGSAIAQLQGPSGEYWTDIEADTYAAHPDLLGLCTETLFECFKAEFVSSFFELVPGKRERLKALADMLELSQETGTY
jgi:hypothetical protein